MIIWLLSFIVSREIEDISAIWSSGVGSNTLCGVIISMCDKGAALDPSSKKLVSPLMS